MNNKYHARFSDTIILELCFNIGPTFIYHDKSNWSGPVFVCMPVTQLRFPIFQYNILGH